MTERFQLIQPHLFGLKCQFDILWQSQVKYIGSLIHRKASSPLIIVLSSLMHETETGGEGSLFLVRMLVLYFEWPNTITRQALWHRAVSYGLGNLFTRKVVLRNFGPSIWAPAKSWAIWVHRLLK